MAQPVSGQQRKFNKYYSPWLRSTESGSSENVPSQRDATLTAIAQLVALRLGTGTGTGTICLIDDENRALLAKAGQRSPLRPWAEASAPSASGLDDHIQDECQWLDKHIYTSIYRLDSLREDTIAYKPFISLNVTDDIRVAEFTPQTSLHGVGFYATVPICTDKGYIIGLLSVHDPVSKSEDIDESDTQFLQDASQIVFHHLDQIKSTIDGRQGEDLVRGLSSFVEGLSSFKQGVTQPEDKFSEAQTSTDSEEPRATDPQDISTRGRPMTQTSSTHESTHTTVSPSDGKFPPVRDPDNQIPKHVMDTNASSNKDSDKAVENMKQVFGRAARSIREATSAQGCVFFDASPSLFAGASSAQPTRALSTESLRFPFVSGSSDDEINDNVESLLSHEPKRGSGGSRKHRGQEPAVILGSSMAPNEAESLPYCLSQKDLRRCLQRYPYGRCFWLADGEVAANDLSASDDNVTGGGVGNQNVALQTADQDPRRPFKGLPDGLLQCLPNAKWLIFLPLFSQAQQQWYAGGFIWSDQSDLHSLDTQIPYLKAFGSCIMSEVTGMEAMNTSMSRTTFIASISHDLRSPLHGMLGNLEFLEDTLTSAYQVSLAGSIETCGKTLLDTIDHLLDYAKINNLNHSKVKSDARRSQSDTKNSTKSKSDSETASSATSILDLALLVEEVTEAAFAGQTFRKKNLRAHDQIDEATHAIHGLALDDCQSTEDTIHQGSAKFSGRVFFLLDIEHADSWLVKAQSPGALRRVVLNIIGNAIKYCNSGLIEARLWKSETTDDHTEVTISIKDTGIGMSQRFLENHLFKAFSQEDSFAAGAGLGMSIARQLVDEMNGSISVKSEKDVGTHVDIHLPMQFAVPSGRKEKDILQTAVRMTSGKKICLLNPNSGEAIISEGQISKLTASIAEMCKVWFGMEFCESTTIGAEADADVFVYAEPPPIEYLIKHHSERRDAGKSGKEIALLIVCTNGFEAAALRAAGVSNLIALGRVIEVISQPVGIRKLAKVLLSSMQRVHASVEAEKTSGSKQGLATADAGQSSADTKWSSTPVVYDPISKRLRPSIGAIKWKSEQPQVWPKIDRSNVNSADLEFGQIKAGLLPEVVPMLPKVIESESGETRMPKVLLVDDNPINLRLLVTFMKKIKLPYVEAVNGLEAYNKFKEADVPFDFVLMDLQMPVMDGLESTRKIREHEKQTERPDPAVIIAITGVGSESVRNDCMESGMNQFLTKPVKFKTLQQMLERHSKD